MKVKPLWAAFEINTKWTQIYRLLQGQFSHQHWLRGFGFEYCMLVFYNVWLVFTRPTTSLWLVLIFCPWSATYITLKFIGINVSLLLTFLLYRNVTFEIVVIDTLASQQNIPGIRDLLRMFRLRLWWLTWTKLCANLHLFFSAMANVSEFQLGGKERERAEPEHSSCHICNFFCCKISLLWCYFRWVSRGVHEKNRWPDPILLKALEC